MNSVPAGTLTSRKRKRLNTDHYDTVNNQYHRSVRSVKRHKLIVRDKYGSLREIKLEDTRLYLLYVATPPMSQRMHKVFRLRFRLPYQSFINLSDDISKHALFKRCTRVGAVW